MTRLLQIAIALLLLTSQTFAQTDAKAQEILKGVSAKYRSYKSLSADFKLVIADQKTKKSENQSGSITIKGSQFNLAMKDQTVMSDGKNSWTFLKESNEVQISEAKTDANAITPATIFSEATSTEIISKTGAKNFIETKSAIHIAGSITKEAIEKIEKQTHKKVVTHENAKELDTPEIRKELAQQSLESKNNIVANDNDSNFNKNLKGLLTTPPPEKKKKK